MSARRSSRPAVSLFEFLAVLVCVTGALILLLLVTTRRMRQQALAEAQVESEPPPGVAEPEPELPPLPPIMLATPEGDAPRWSPPQPASEPVIPVVPQPDPYEEAVRANAALRREWESNVASLESEWAALQQNWDDWEATLTAAELAIQNMQSRLRQLDGESSTMVDQESALDADARQLMQRHADLQSEIDSTAALLEAVRNAPKPEASRFSILPYDYASGTTRRPIIIECTENQITFASEGIVLRPGDLEGFTPAFNPLQAGADVLVDYWRDHDPEAGRDGDPYVLLVVRPGGTISYYIARKLLETVGDRFGYELVGEHQEFVWPETTPAATEACREAVESCLVERNRAIESVGGGHLPVAGPLQFVDDRGNFFLEEVAELRGVQSGGGPAEGAPSGSGGTPSNRRDLSAIFGNGVEEYADNEPQRGGRSNGGMNPPTEPRSHQLHPARTSTGGQETATNAAPVEGATSVATGGQSGGTQSADRQGQRQGAGQPSSPGSGSDSEAPWPQGFQQQTPSWIEERRGPDSSPSYQTHPGLIPRGAGPSAQVSPPASGAARGPLVMEAGRSTQVGGAAGDGSAGAEQSPAPVFSGSEETPSPQRTVGYRRDIFVFIDGSSFQVAGMEAVAINPQMTREQVADLLAAGLQAQIAAWEAAPEGGAWVPRVRFEVRRGGNAYLRTMTQIVGDWQVNWTANYTTD